ncbi:MAG: hypothetical protein CFH08_01561 [Alphaproteobacteria bacterium MarineAlpha3_Bin7]|nr:MAG: hypothetical protein CFH08_01561 [Alphaproteobacteria bacterium MarineAlpha3_Bin7]
MVGAAGIDPATSYLKGTGVFNFDSDQHKTNILAGLLPLTDPKLVHFICHTLATARWCIFCD